jgi:hypothetical protein
MPTNKRFADILATANDTYTSPQDETKPPGLYIFQLQDVSLYEADKDDGSVEIKIKWEHLIREGEYQGQVVTDRSSPMSPKAFPIRLMNERLQAFGHEPPSDLRDLEELLNQIRAAAPVYRGKMTVRNGWENVKVLEVLSSSEPPATTSAPPTRNVAPVESDDDDAGELAVGMAVSIPVDEDGTQGEGTIVKIDGGEIDVDVDGTVYGPCTLEDITVLDDSGDAESDDADEGDDISASLLELAQANGIDDVTDSMNQDELVATLGAYEWQASELTEDEVALLESVEIAVVKPAPKPKPKPKAKPKTAKKAVKKAKKKSRK